MHDGFEFFSGALADFSDASSSLSDDHAFVAVLGGEDGSANVEHVVFATFYFFYLYVCCVGDFLSESKVEFFSDELCQPELVWHVCELTGWIVGFTFWESFVEVVDQCINVRSS